MKNILTGKDVPAYFTSLNYDATTFATKLPLTSVELPYFAVRSIQTNPMRANPLDGADSDFADITSEIAWHKIPTENTKQADVLRELKFLEPMGLALFKDGDFYISRLVYILYDANDGIFAHFESDQTATDRKERLTPLMRLFLTYILPGQYWQAFYARQYLASKIGETTELNGMLLDIQKAWNAIEAEYSMPAATESGP